MIFTVMMSIFTDEHNRIKWLWISSAHDDKNYTKVWQTIKKEVKWFPSELNLKALITEYQADDDSTLQFRNWCWAPKLEPLWTALIHDVHTFILTNHVSWHNIYSILACDFFWSEMFDDDYWYIWNCDMRGRTKPWQNMKQEFLKSLLIPNRIWQEILMNFIVALSESEGYSNIMIVTDRLSKNVSLTALLNLEVEMVIQSFIKNVFSLHETPLMIVSDWGSQFISEFWVRFCETLNIQYQLFTVFHPQTDGFTERMNSVIKLMLRAFSNWDQINWAPLLLIIQLAIKNHVASATEVSSFFLFYSYELDIIQMELSQIKESFNGKFSKSWVDAVMSKMRNIMKFAQTVMINVQQK